MASKQIAIRVDSAIADKLRLQAVLQRRSVNAIVNEAIAHHLDAHPVSRETMLQMVRAIAMEDAALLKALAEA